MFYFLLPDRFSNGQERSGRLLDCDLSTPEGIKQIRLLRGLDWRWDRWQQSGQDRFQGGTLAGIRSKLGYLSDLGVTTLWIGPVFRQRVEGNSYHGYGIQDFLDIGEQREIVCNVAKGLQPAGNFFAGFNYYDDGMGSHRNWGGRHLSISNDHDHVFGPKVRFAAGASNDHQGVAVAALQLLALGIPCLYYGTEQGLASGAEEEEQEYLPWGDWRFVSLDQWLLGPSEVMVLANRSAIETARMAWHGAP